MIETCAECRQGYEVTPVNSGIVLYLLYPPANHLLATCPHCQSIAVIYMKAAVVMDLIKLGTFSLVVEDNPTPDRRAAADACWRRGTDAQGRSASTLVAGSDLPEAPREWLRQLHDDLRQFGRAS
jgi:hypothetical protein